MSNLPNELWHDGWNQADWDRYCVRRRLFWFTFVLAFVIAALIHRL